MLLDGLMIKIASTKKKDLGTMRIELLTIIFATVSLYGCNSSSSDEPNGVVETSNTIIGKVADGYLQSAKVCLDINQNMACDINEPSGFSDSGGNFSFDFADDIDMNAHPILAIIDENVIDADTNSNIVYPYTLVSPPGHYQFVSPMTTLIAMAATDYSDESIANAAKLLQTKLGVNSSVDLFEDFIAKSSNGESDYTLIHKTAQLTARQLGLTLDKLNANTNEYTKQFSVAVSKSLDDIEQLAELASTYEDVSSDAILAIKKNEWENEALSLNFDEAYIAFINKKSMPLFDSGSIYKFVSSNMTESIVAEATFYGTNADLTNTYSVSLRNSTNDILYTFDSSNLQIIDDKVQLKHNLGSVELSDDTYSITISSESSGLVVLTTVSFKDTEATHYPASILENSAIHWVFDEEYPFINWPMPNSEWYYSVQLVDRNDNILYETSKRKGSNRSWLDNTLDMNDIVTANVYAQDSNTTDNLNFVQHLWTVPIIQSNSLIHNTFSQAYVSYNPIETETSTTYKEQLVFQNNAKSVVQNPESAPVTPNLKSIGVETWNGSTYVNVLNITLDWEREEENEQGITKVGEAYEVYDFDTKGAEWRLWQELLINEYTSYMDSYYVSNNINDLSLYDGMYRFVFEDINDREYISYSSLELGKGHPKLDAKDVTIETLNFDWVKVSVSPDTDYSGSTFYEYNIRLDITKEEGDDVENVWLDKFRSGTLPIGVVQKDKILKAVNEYKETYNPFSTGDVYIQLSITDSSRSPGVNVDLDVGMFPITDHIY